MDHIRPWRRGGLTLVSNGQTLCATCNASKGDKLIAEWKETDYYQSLANPRLLAEPDYKVLNAKDQLVLEWNSAYENSSNRVTASSKLFWKYTKELLELAKIMRS